MKIAHDSDTIFQVNHEGWATVFNGREGKNYQSKNQVKSFDFRGENYHDGTDYFEITQAEMDLISKAFDFEEVDIYGDEDAAHVAGAHLFQD